MGQKIAQKGIAMALKPLLPAGNGSSAFHQIESRAMANDGSPEKIDLRYVASQNERLFRELRGILERLDISALSDEQLQAKLNELLRIVKGANR
jgi:hypothetical protein